MLRCSSTFFKTGKRSKTAKISKDLYKDKDFQQLLIRSLDNMSDTQLMGAAFCLRFQNKARKCISIMTLPGLILCRDSTKNLIFSFNLDGNSNSLAVLLKKKQHFVKCFLPVSIPSPFHTAGNLFDTPLKMFLHIFSQNKKAIHAVFGTKKTIIKAKGNSN